KRRSKKSAKKNVKGKEDRSSILEKTGKTVKDMTGRQIQAGRNGQIKANGAGTTGICGMSGMAKRTFRTKRRNAISMCSII
ncbi:MAG: hypothetical protein IK139_02540, partial [Lachnospiraceae bacterium]|nr:hypothetical protein [Lachnospiraceae bacterium]